MPEPETEIEESKDQDPEGGSEDQPEGDQGNETVEERLKKMEQELADSKRKITDLANEKGALEKRFEEMTRPPLPEAESTPKAEDTVKKAVQEALEDAQLDPKAGAEKLANLINQTRADDEKKFIKKAMDTVNRDMEFRKEFEAHVEEVKKANPDLVKFEQRIARDVSEKIQAGKPYKKAFEEAISEFRRDFGDLIKRESPAPKGSQGESGGGSGSAPKEKAENTPKDFGDAADESPEAYVALRKQIVARKGA